MFDFAFSRHRWFTKIDFIWIVAIVSFIQIIRLKMLQISKSEKKMLKSSFLAWYTVLIGKNKNMQIS